MQTTKIRAIAAVLITLMGGIIWLTRTEAENLMPAKQTLLECKGAPSILYNYDIQGAVIKDYYTDKSYSIMMCYPVWVSKNEAR